MNKPTPDQEQKLWAYFENEWEQWFIQNFGASDLSDKDIAALKLGFFGGIEAGAKSIHNANEIIN